MEKEYTFTREETKWIKKYAKGEIGSRALGGYLHVSHTRAIHIAGRYFVQLYSKGKLKILK